MPKPQTPAAKSRGLRTHLVALVAAALLPAFAVGAIAVAAAVETYRQAFEDRLESTATALASAVDTELASSILALSTLATARTLDDAADLHAFHARARRAAAILGTRVFLIAPNGTIALHTDEPFGTPPYVLQRSPPRWRGRCSPPGAPPWATSSADSGPEAP